ncbi:MAG: hypothetical protein H6603_02450 [Flavobacteriales bacterium]|nr:hypothetical protein [Flavobacteriales bacterium]
MTVSKETVTTIAGFAIILVVVLAYQYWDYTKRAIAINAMKVYADSNGFEQAGYLNELNINLFDAILESQGQSQFVYIQPKSFNRLNDAQWRVQCFVWNEPNSMETKLNFILSRDNDKFNLIEQDNWFAPQDTIQYSHGEIQSTRLKWIVDWVDNHH